MNKDSFTSFPNWMSLVSFFLRFLLSTMLSRNGESKHPCLVPDHKGKALSMMLTVDKDAFYEVEVSSFNL